MTAPGKRYEWRVTYRRFDWRTTTYSATRRFSRLADVHRFLSKLDADDRPDLSPAIWELHRRPVGAWEPVDADDER